jgi:hypothetical protein
VAVAVAVVVAIDSDLPNREDSPSEGDRRGPRGGTGEDERACGRKSPCLIGKRPGLIGKCPGLIGKCPGLIGRSPLLARAGRPRAGFTGPHEALERRQIWCRFEPIGKSLYLFGKCPCWFGKCPCLIERRPCLFGKCPCLIGTLSTSERADADAEGQKEGEESDDALHRRICPAKVCGRRVWSRWPSVCVCVCVCE